MKNEMKWTSTALIEKNDEIKWQREESLDSIIIVITARVTSVGLV